MSADPGRVEQTLQIVDSVDGSTVDRNQAVADLDTGARRGTHRHDLENVHGAAIGQSKMPHDPGSDRDGRSRYADIRAPDAAVSENLSDDPLRRVDPGGEANRLRLGNHRRVYADHAPLGVDQRTARVSWVERRIGLNDIVHQPARRCTQRAAERRYDTRRDCLRISQWVADGDRNLAHANAR